MSTPDGEVFLDEDDILEEINVVEEEAPPINPIPNQQQQYSSYPPPPQPPLDPAYPPLPSQPAPPGQMYFPSSQYPQFNNWAVMVVLTSGGG
ncbi:hypothetical protein L1987_09900 [Smallanthus sonchifolius]|uniref:Uncharacterized protein n=1 Tax=Smallanthus sonchifolius TaxID=185202 RepID=A0ACB9JQK5_9ASTR|nr:hypothetical protein L1987_09900 [Smallanthus sonchifolius]